MSINGKNAIPLLLTGAAAYLGVGGQAKAGAAEALKPQAIATATMPGQEAVTPTTIPTPNTAPPALGTYVDDGKGSESTTTTIPTPNTAPPALGTYVDDGKGNNSSETPTPEQNVSTDTHDNGNILAKTGKSTGKLLKFGGVTLAAGGLLRKKSKYDPQDMNVPKRSS